MLLSEIKKDFNGDVVSDEVQNSRYKICNKCNFERGGTCIKSAHDHLVLTKTHADEEREIKLGREIKYKTWGPNQSCPIGKWGESPSVKAEEALAVDNSNQENAEVVKVGEKIDDTQKPQGAPTDKKAKKQGLLNKAKNFIKGKFSKKGKGK